MHEIQQPQNIHRGSVMDVHARKPQQYANGVTKIDAPVTKPMVASSGDVANSAPSEPSPASGIQSFSSLEVVDPETNTQYGNTAKPRGLSPELLKQAEQETKKEEEAKQAMLAAQKANKRMGPIIVSVLAVIIALSLAGLATYAYISQSGSNNSVRPTSGAQSNSSTQEVSRSSTSTAVDDATKEIDDLLKSTTTSNEVPETSLSDSAVGL